MRAVAEPHEGASEGMLRMFGIPESEIAETLRDAEEAGIELEGLEMTTCLHRGELEVTTSYEPRREEAYDELAGFVAERHPGTLFSTDGARSTSRWPRCCSTRASRSPSRSPARAACLRRA